MVYFDDYYSDTGEVLLSWIPVKVENTTVKPVYQIFYSNENNIGTVEEILTNGTPVTGYSSDEPYFMDLKVSKDLENCSVKIMNLKVSERIYINILADLTGYNQKVCYETALVTYYDDDTAVIVGDGNNYGYVTNYTNPDNRKFEYYFDITGSAKDIYTGVYNFLDTQDDNFLDTITQLDNRTFPNSGNNLSITRNEEISTDNLNIVRNIAGKMPGPLKTTMPSSLYKPLRSETPHATEVSFKDSGREYTSTLRYTDTVSTAFGEKTLKIWVENSSWTDGGTEAYLTQEMVNILAEKFLSDGSGNDIYDWVTNIFGEEWGDHSSNYYILPNNEINILLADLEGDNSTDGGVLGFFWGKDNVKKTSESLSNERIMFYIDSLLYSKAEGSWDITDYWPSEVLSTLGHEFQHMINFYQTAVKRSIYPETWLNEMLSLTTEDILSEKLGTPGPRGYLSVDGSTSPTGNITKGRIPLYNFYTTTPFFTWLPDTLDNNKMPYVLRSYSLMYVYGAYLVRNFGGPEILREIMYNAYDEKSLEIALGKLDYKKNSSYRFTLNHLPSFIVAVLLSDHTDMKDYHTFNNGGWFRYNLNGIDYKLGSINFYDYNIKPKAFTPEEIKTYFGDNIPGRSFLITKHEDMKGRYKFSFSSGDDDYSSYYAAVVR